MTLTMLLCNKSLQTCVLCFECIDIINAISQHAYTFSLPKRLRLLQMRMNHHDSLPLKLTKLVFRYLFYNDFGGAIAYLLFNRMLFKNRNTSLNVYTKSFELTVIWILNRLHVIGQVYASAFSLNLATKFKLKLSKITTLCDLR